MSNLRRPNSRGSLAKSTLLAGSLICLYSCGEFSGLAGETSTSVPGYISDVTIALILNWTKENGTKTAGGLQTRSGTSTTASLGNKEFLQYLRDEKLLVDTSISGWKILQVSSLDDTVGGLFAFKKGKVPVKLPEDVFSIGVPSGYDTLMYGEAETYSEVSKADMIVSLSKKGRYVGGVAGTFPVGAFKGVKFKAVAFDVVSASSSYGKTGEVSRHVQSYRKIASLVGAGDPSSAVALELWELPLVEGNVSIGASTSTDVSAFAN
jgi:hypothetical protein